MRPRVTVAVYISVLLRDLADGYHAMAGDEERESEAAEWVENLTGEIACESGE